MWIPFGHGNKSTFIITAKECFIIHVDAHEGNPYDGHTLAPALDSANESMRHLIGKTLTFLFADKDTRDMAIKRDYCSDGNFYQQKEVQETQTTCFHRIGILSYQESIIGWEGTFLKD